MWHIIDIEYDSILYIYGHMVHGDGAVGHGVLARWYMETDPWYMESGTWRAWDMVTLSRPKCIKLFVFLESEKIIYNTNNKIK